MASVRTWKTHEIGGFYLAAGHSVRVDITCKPASGDGYRFYHLLGTSAPNAWGPKKSTYLVFGEDGVATSMNEDYSINFSARVRCGTQGARANEILGAYFGMHVGAMLEDAERF